MKKQSAQEIGDKCTLAPDGFVCMDCLQEYVKDYRPLPYLNDKGDDGPAHWPYVKHEKIDWPRLWSEWRTPQ